MNRRVAFAPLLSLAVALAVAGCAGNAAPPEEVAPVVIYLARHAETIYPPPAEAPRDPQLNSMGQDRADALARLLMSEPITHVFSTDYQRTRETAAPTATAHGLSVELYDPTDLAAAAQALRATSGRHLVLGHSNTTPELVALLGGDAGAPIDESVEFDRLYVVTITGERVTTSLLRYGAPVPSNWRDMAGERRPEPQPQEPAGVQQ